MVARVFCVANQKGGVGKTTTALNLAAGLAQSGAHALLVDLDPQCNATAGLGHQPTASHPLVTATPIRQGVLATAVAGLELLPGSRSFRDVELLTRDDPRQSARIREQLLSGFAGYDFVLIDCPPSLGPLTRTALSSSTEVFMPIQCEYFAMEGLAQMIEVIRDVMQDPVAQPSSPPVAQASSLFSPGQVVDLPPPGQIFDRLASQSTARQVNSLPHAPPRPSLQFGGIVLTMYDRTLELTREVDDEVRDFFGEIVFSTVIPRDVAVSEAPSHGKSVMDYAPRSRGARAYVELCMEVLDRE